MYVGISREVIGEERTIHKIVGMVPYDVCTMSSGLLASGSNAKKCKLQTRKCTPLSRERELLRSIHQK